MKLVCAHQPNLASCLGHHLQQARRCNPRCIRRPCYVATPPASSEARPPIPQRPKSEQKSATPATETRARRATAPKQRTLRRPCPRVRDWPQRATRRCPCRRAATAGHSPRLLSPGGRTLGRVVFEGPTYEYLCLGACSGRGCGNELRSSSSSSCLAESVSHSEGENKGRSFRRAVQTREKKGLSPIPSCP